MQGSSRSDSMQSGGKVTWSGLAKNNTINQPGLYLYPGKDEVHYTWFLFPKQSLCEVLNVWNVSYTGIWVYMIIESSLSDMCNSIGLYLYKLGVFISGIVKSIWSWPSSIGVHISELSGTTWVIMVMYSMFAGSRRIKCKQCPSNIYKGEVME